MCCKPLPPTPAINSVFTIYYYSKLYEFLDIIFVSLMGFPLHPHFQFHHCTTLSFAWTFLFYRSAHGGTFLLANVFMHILLYLYLSQDRTANNLLHNKVVFYMIRVWGHAQLLIGMVMAWYSLEHSSDFFYLLVSFSFYLTCLFLISVLIIPLSSLQ
jgi:hypothetical protein